MRDQGQCSYRWCALIPEVKELRDCRCVMEGGGTWRL